jgi:hypothetical protein
MTSHHPPASSWSHVLGAVLGLTALLSLLLTAFAWPAANTEPRHVPLAVAAPTPLAAQVEQGLAARAGAEAFDVLRVPDRAAAVAAIEDREVYGGFVLGPQGAEVLTASAASPVVAQALAQVAAGQSAGAQAGPQAAAAAASPQVTDVVPLPGDDPRGAGLAAGVLPLVLGGIAGAAVLALRVTGTGRRLAGALGFAVAGGMATVAILQYWLGSLAGDYVSNAAVVALAVAATATTLLGLERLLGLEGLGVGAAVMLLLGNPLSGVTSAPELLPWGWGTLGQLLPPGAAVTTLRSVAFFDGAGAGPALAVLGCWLAGGLLLLAVPVRSRRRLRVADPAAA